MEVAVTVIIKLNLFRKAKHVRLHALRHVLANKLKSTSVQPLLPFGLPTKAVVF
jgi:hypothetical protein